MKKTILAFTLITGTLLASSLSEKAPEAEPASNLPKKHQAYFSFCCQNSLHEDAPPLLALGLGYHYHRENATSFKTTALSLDLGFSPPQNDSYKALLVKDSELLALGRVMALHYFNPSDKWKYFLSIGGHFSLSNYERTSSFLQATDDGLIEMTFYSIQEADTTYSYIGPSMIIGVEFLTPKAEASSFALQLGYDHPMICIKGYNRSHEFGRIFIGYNIGF